MPRQVFEPTAIGTALAALGFIKFGFGRKWHHNSGEGSSKMNPKYLAEHSFFSVYVTSALDHRQAIVLVVRMT